MSVIENLVRVGRRQCDERRRYLAELEHLAERLRADARRLYSAVESAAAAAPPDIRVADAASARPLLARYRKLTRSVAEIDGQIAAARASLAAAEDELRRQEAALAQHTAGLGRRGSHRLRRGRPARAVPPVGGRGG